jgi:hypothetical protein
MPGRGASKCAEGWSRAVGPAKKTTSCGLTAARNWGTNLRGVTRTVLVGSMSDFNRADCAWSEVFHTSPVGVISEWIRISKQTQSSNETIIALIFRDEGQAPRQTCGSDESIGDQ